MYKYATVYLSIPLFGSFPVWAIMNATVMNIFVLVFSGTYITKTHVLLIRREGEEGHNNNYNNDN